VAAVVVASRCVPGQVNQPRLAARCGGAAYGVNHAVALAFKEFIAHHNVHLGSFAIVHSNRRVIIFDEYAEPTIKTHEKKHLFF
jgi:hypothetical protein